MKLLVVLISLFSGPAFATAIDLGVSFSKHNCVGTGINRSCKQVTNIPTQYVSLTLGGPYNSATATTKFDIQGKLYLVDIRVSEYVLNGENKGMVSLRLGTPETLVGQSFSNAVVLDGGLVTFRSLSSTLGKLTNEDGDSFSISIHRK